MGDSGSLMIGLVNAILVIKFINIAEAPFVLFPIESAVAVGFAVLIVPLLDTLRVFSIRIFKGRSPFTPDRNHIHHLLLDWELSHPAVTFSCISINIGFVVLAYFSRSIGPTYLFLSMLALAFTGIGLLYYRRGKRSMIIAKRVDGITELKSSSKVVTLTKETASIKQN